MLERTRVTLLNRITFSMVGLVAKQQRIHWKCIVYLSARLWFSEYFLNYRLGKKLSESKNLTILPKKTQTKHGELLMKGLDFSLPCISVWTPYI